MSKKIFIIFVYLNLFYIKISKETDKEISIHINIYSRELIINLIGLSFEYFVIKVSI